jgi:hypothetical protein
MQRLISMQCLRLRPSARTSLIYRHASTIPRVAEPSIWRSLVPKYFRDRSVKRSRSKSKQWNPANFFIIMFILIGSQSIQQIALRNGYAAFNRQADARIRQLRDVLDKLNRGEDVDVAAALGTGDPDSEKEWEECKVSHILFGPKLTCCSTERDFRGRHLSASQVKEEQVSESKPLE